MAENHHGVGTRLSDEAILLGHERPTMKQRNAEELEEPGRHLHRREPFRFSTPCQRHGCVAVGNRMLLSGLAFFVMAAVFLLASRTEQSELTVKEKLLEIEYRLAEFSEKVDPLRKGP